VKSNDRIVALGVALFSASLLGYELTQIRIFAYTLHPVIAFTAIAIAMLGFGIGATLLALKPKLAEGGGDRLLARLALAFALSSVAVSAWFARVSTRIIEPATFTVDVGWTAAVMLPAIFPYCLAGLAIATVLHQHVRHIGRIYFWNLLGSALGAIAMILMLRPLGGTALVLVFAALAAAAGCLLAPTSPRHLRVAALVVAAACAAGTPFAGALFPLEPDVTGYNAQFERWERAQGYGAPVQEFDEWDPVGRLEVLRHTRDTIEVPEEIGFRVLTVDGGAMTLLLEEPRGLPSFGQGLFGDSIYGVAYQLLERPRVLVIGVGGGTDVEAALHAGARSVTGVEISLSTVRAVTEKYADFAGWPKNPAVKLLHADGRSFAKSTAERFDLVQMSGVDTVTTHASGSMVTVEDYLYTVEAFRDFLGLLRPGGYLSVVRFGDEAMNLSHIAIEALRRLGVARPESCIAAFRQNRLSGVLVKRTPFTAADVDALRRFERRSGNPGLSIPHYDLVGLRLGDPVQLLHPSGATDAPRYRFFFDAAAEGREDQAEAKLGSTFIVPTDDRPYYMMGVWLSSLRHEGATHPALKLLVVASIVIAVAALALILVPVFPLIRVVGGRRRILVGTSVYFFGLGAGFMLLEVGLIHQALVFVGTPGASVAVVLSSIMVASGLGSRFADGLSWGAPRRLVVALVGLVAAGTSYRFGAGPAFDALFCLPIPGRCLVAAAMIAPVGFFMGWFFPTGLRVAGVSFSRLVPWAIAINGFASVIGSLCTFFLGIALGFGGVFAIAMALYAVAVASYLPLARAASGEPVKGS
jgi:hypothetical protein